MIYSVWYQCLSMWGSLSKLNFRYNCIWVQISWHIGTFLPSSQWKTWQILIFSYYRRVNSTSALFQQHFTQFHFVSTLDFVCHHQIHCITLLAFGTCARIFPFCFSGSSYWRTLPEWTCKFHSLYKVCSKETYLRNANYFSEQLHKSLENGISDSLPHLVCTEIEYITIIWLSGGGGVITVQ